MIIPGFVICAGVNYPLIQAYIVIASGYFGTERNDDESDEGVIEYPFRMLATSTGNCQMFRRDQLLFHVILSA